MSQLVGNKNNLFKTSGSNTYSQFFAISLVCILLLMAPAIWNGFPLVFADTGTYIDAAVQRYLPGDRTIFYSFFILPLHLKISLWPVVAVQAVISFYLIRVFFRVFSERFRDSHLVVPVLLLSALSSLPWFVGQIMPDVFSGLLILAIATGVIGQDRLSSIERVVLPLLIAFFITTHLSYLLVAAGTFAGALLIRLGGAGTLAARLFSRFNLSVVGAIALAMLIMMGINVVSKKGFTFAYTGNVMFLAKTIDQGIGIDYLEQSCPGNPLPVCAVLPELRKTQQEARLNHLPIGSASDHFLWKGPLDTLGGMTEVAKYASVVNHGTLSRYPLEFVHQCLLGFVSQLGNFATGDDLIKYDLGSSPYAVVKKDFKEGTFGRFLASRQYAETLHVDVFRTLDYIALALSAVVIVLLVLARWRSEMPLLQFFVVICIGIAANDLVTGGLSAVHDRYGSRVIWLLPLLAIFVLRKFVKARRAA